MSLEEAGGLGRLGLGGRGGLGLECLPLAEGTLMRFLSLCYGRVLWVLGRHCSLR